ncbi:MAG TPA: hypothetical protein VGQ59_19310, partial [Cyclobacteriaceae bacterium]|nr:hypothetical protein [Cyclobacteriaceae bacterium]
LKNFYKVYIMTFEDYLKINPGHPDQLTAKIDSIERAYLTSKFYNYLKTVNKDGLVLDFDPFIGGQMIDKLMLEEMTFKKIDNDLYEVHYKYGDYYNKVKLRIGKESGLFKIRDAFFEADGREYELTKEEWNH